MRIVLEGNHHVIGRIIDMIEKEYEIDPYDMGDDMDYRLAQHIIIGKRLKEGGE